VTGRGYPLISPASTIFRTKKFDVPFRDDFVREKNPVREGVRCAALIAKPLAQEPYEPNESIDHICMRKDNTLRHQECPTIVQDLDDNPNILTRDFIFESSCNMCIAYIIAADIGGFEGVFDSD